jgi:hypothetical protein
MTIMNGLVSSLSNREKRLRIALFVLPVLVVVFALLISGALDSGAPPKVHVSIAPVTAAALPDGAVAEVSTPDVYEGELSIDPVSGRSDDFLYDILKSDTNNVTILAATASADIDTTPASDAHGTDPRNDIPQSNSSGAATAATAEVAPATSNGNGAHGGAILEI